MKKHITTCTQNGMTKSQPGMCVSTSSYNGVVILNVYRSRNIKNSFGGIGRSAHCDAHGKQFKTTDAAYAYALDHGYLQVFNIPQSIRQRRVKAAIIPKKYFN
jgi:hypothetical protein